jgi:hypothetical protein
VQRTSKDAHEFTARAIAAGLAIGTLLCFSNCYFGLQVSGLLSPDTACMHDAWSQILLLYEHARLLAA